jgi:hypothetical protein
VEELGLAYGEARIDIAVVNGRFHGFEIKSDADTLTRLPNQVIVYNNVFDRVTIIAGSKHIDAVRRVVPEWWGIKMASSGPRGAIYFEEQRPSRQNDNINPLSVASLLWRNEIFDALGARGIKGIKSKTRPQLAEILATTLSLAELRGLIRHTLKTRQGWRSDAQRAPYDDLLLPYAKLPDFQ